MFALFVFLILVGAAAYVGAQFQGGAWYAGLVKPTWTPPGWVFAPVWALLYVAIAIAGWESWRGSRRLDLALTFWLWQLVLNAGWSWLFFGLHRPGLALLDLVALQIVIVGFIATAWSASPPAAKLFVPYLLWVGFALALNWQIWRLNP